MGGGGDSRRWRWGWVGLVVDAIVDTGVDAGRESCIAAIDPVGAREHHGC